jgi:hypothetical protein
MKVSTSQPWGPVDEHEEGELHAAKAFISAIVEPLLEPIAVHEIPRPILARALSEVALEFGRQEGGKYYRPAVGGD